VPVKPCFLLLKYQLLLKFRAGFKLFTFNTKARTILVLRLVLCLLVKNGTKALYIRVVCFGLGLERY
jgi:hypothetical protein